MIESVTIATQTGIVLWKKSILKNDEALINEFIETGFIPEIPKPEIGGYRVHFMTENEHDLIIILLHSKMIKVPYAQQVLSACISEFSKRYQGDFQPVEFDKVYNIIIDTYKITAGTTRKQPRKFEETKKYQNSLVGSNTVAKNVDSEISNDLDKSGKEMREWGIDGSASKKVNRKLDFSEKSENTTRKVDFGNGLVKLNTGEFQAPELSVQPKQSSRLFSLFENLTVGRKLTEEELTPAASRMKEHLVNKNVSAPVAEHLCNRILESLVGKKLSTISSIDKLVKEEMSQILSAILSPNSSTDLLAEIKESKRLKVPYVIVFIGVNGVGKSTNLSKVSYWLLQNGCSLLIAACDTFRSGAVEQLRVHVKNLSSKDDLKAKCELFDRGYGKDPAGIAKEAIGFAKSNSFDVCLIDTAGRMQDNEPLMKALAKLVATNNPNKIIFVGEALVGNEAIDQLTKFNRYLKDFSGMANPRQIDGMILSKFDTVDDKVGAALSMTYITGKPIFFLGTGQTYSDLKRMNVQSVVETLLQ